MVKKKTTRSGRSEKELKGVTLLGNQNTKYKYEYDPSILERFKNKHPGKDYWVTFNIPEFTSLCVTGDTLIKVVDDSTDTIKEVPIKDLVGQTGTLVSFNTERGQVVHKAFTDVRKTRENADVVKVDINLNGDETRSLVVTPDHLVLVAENGYKWVEAKDLETDHHVITTAGVSMNVNDFLSGNVYTEAQVVNVSYHHGRLDVYNMEVEETECYFANDIVVHNCPKTGQPDFATIYINYIPDKYLVESKSLKLYMFSFRNHGDFHEDVINIIAEDLFQLLKPKYIEVWGEFTPRGGISIDPFAQRYKKGYKKFAQYRMMNRLLKQPIVKARNTL